MEEKSPAKKSSVDSTNGAPKKTDQKDFLAVGLGASAGGVKALQEFFATMPPNSGMAFVVILHLSPAHESSLAPILQAQTTMPVIQVNETHKVEPNHVYVIPPNQNLEMVDGVVRLAKQDREQGKRVAIDVFFRTLAEAYERNAVCVVLSGTGSDGTLGLKRVKETNGFAIVQSPEDAEYDQMPRNAIATGLADWIMPVRQMPEKLISFRDSSERLYLTNGSDAAKVAEQINAEDLLREIITILRVRTGHDFSNYKTPTLVRRIARHLQIHELEDLPTYINLLRDNPKEIESLQRNLLINVTNFFRDKAAFDALRAEALPKLFTGRTSRETIRVWSAGCASGEEAFSLAMLFQEYAEKRKDPPKFQIFATDVDDDAIQQARANSYPETIETDVSPERLRRFFVRDGSRYRVKKELRETVLFAPHNVLRDPPFSKLDLVTCRNLLIYLNRGTQERALEIFHFALGAGGFLFLGSSETAESAAELFEVTNKKQRLYRRRFGAAYPFHAPPPLPIRGNWRSVLPDARKTAERVKAFSMGEIHYKLLESFAPPSVLVNQDFDVVYMSESVGRFLRFTGGKPSNNLLKIVHADLLPDLRAALYAAHRARQPSEFPRIPIVIDDRVISVNLRVRVVEGDGGDFLLVIFDEADDAKPSAEERAKKAVESPSKTNQTATVVQRLEEELQSARAKLRATVEQHEFTIEDLKASNEELQAINEELRSASEELETSKEELHSVNEEMTTVNYELKEKMDEAARFSADLQNLLESTDIATIFLDENLHIKRFSPLVEKLFNILPSDIGRPLEHLTHHLNYGNLTTDAREVLRSSKMQEREIFDENGRAFLTRFAPYRMTGDRIEGVVLNFLEITKYKRAEGELETTRRKYRDELEREVGTRTRELKESRDELERRSRVFQETLSSITDFAYQFDRAGRFIYVNQSLLDLWGLTEEEAVGKDFSQLGYPNELAEKLYRQIERVFTTGESLRDETAYTSPTGVSGFYEYIFTPLKDAHGAVQSVVGSTRDITARKQTDEALRESEERLNLAANISGFGVHDYDLESNRLYWSPELKAMHGLEPEAPIDFDNLGKYIHPEDRARVDSAVRHALDPQGSGEFEQEFRVRRADTGELRWLYNRSQTLISGAGKRRKAVRNTGVVIDVTERKRAEEALRDSDMRFRAVINQTNAGIAEFDLQGNYTLVNQSLCEMLGYTREQLLTMNMRELTHPDDLPGCLEIFERAIRTGEVLSSEKRLIRQDTSVVWISESLSSINDGGSRKPQRAAMVAIDITQRKRAEEMLNESEERLRLLIESASDFAIFTTDRQGVVTDWSAGAENIFGWTHGEIIGRSADVLFTPEDRARSIPDLEMKTALETGRAAAERQHVRKDGSRFYASGIVRTLKDGEVKGFVKIARDMTEQLRAERAVSEKDTLQKLVGAQEDERKRIARDLHDHLGQQLTALRLKLEAARKMCQADELLCTQIDETQRIARSIDEDVDFLAWELRPAALDDLGLAAALEIYAKEWARHSNVNAEFYASGLGGNRLAPEVETNLYRIAQEALNNVSKHARARNANLILEKRGSLVVLIVEDDGAGFDVEDKNNRNKGIGLIGMQERAALVGGKLQIESSQATGTTVFVRIPFE